ncbi:hypothetical protein [Sphingopyxis macrogoltabida]|uniref:Uncharacterized protein n=1 Tax=Sphingopyxis macrogoltabida TaxID=33050 RepID=A0AAC9FGJ6_SPHMC|nr:hypothetical protein [Sphingopyxis macrogoltabida]ALJ15332.1 hypothetical protein LH19_20855 [Sphingopyxis macrogoltabida]AMU91583.1 hypothetical protein ATM17_21445 [Sphingopyxis macrogoltabida]
MPNELKTEIVAKIPVGQLTELRVAIVSLNGSEHLDIRRFEDRGLPEMVALSEGFAVPRNRVVELCDAITMASDKLGLHFHSSTESTANMEIIMPETEGLSPAARAAFEWAITVPPMEKITEQPDFKRHMDHLSDAESVAVLRALESRAAALDAEGKEMLTYIAERADPSLTPAQIRACDWACTIHADLTGHPDFLEYFGALTPEERKQCGVELRRRGEMQRREADLLEEEGRRRFGADFMTGG